MYFIAILCSFYVISVQTLNIKIADIGSRKVYYNISDAKELFDDFIQTFSKHYDNVEEYNKRFNTFVENLKDVNERNSKIRTTVFGITPLLDLTEEEFLSKYTGARRATAQKLKIRLNTTLNFNTLQKDVPKNWDWRTRGLVTPAKHQGQCGSCWAFSAIACLEGQYAKKYGRLQSLSEQQLLDCTRGCSCEGGWVQMAFEHAIRLGGVMSESFYTYQQKKLIICIATFWKNFVVKAIGYDGYGHMNEDDLKHLVYEYGPVSVSMHAQGRYFDEYKGGIAYPHDMYNNCSGDVNHAVTIVGYGEENGVQYWIIKNSHGNFWGEKGFMRLQRGINACSIAQDVVTVKIE